MKIFGIILCVISFWLVVSFAWGVRRNTKTGASVTMQTVNMAMLFFVQNLIVGIFHLNPLHFLWMIPLSFFLGILSISFPFSLLTPLGNIYAHLCCIGLDKEEIERNNERMSYFRQLKADGLQNDEAIRKATEKYPFIKK